MSAASSTWPYDRARHGGIDEVALPIERGRLWLCGKHRIGPDPAGLLHEMGATTVVCLTEEYELAERYPAYVQWLHDHRSAEAVWHPIADMGVPPPHDAALLVAELTRRLGAGEGLVMHCGAGIGRAGTMAVATLVALGEPLRAALDTVAASRPMAGPEAGVQMELLEHLALG